MQCDCTTPHTNHLHDSPLLNLHMGWGWHYSSKWSNDLSHGEVGSIRSGGISIHETFRVGGIGRKWPLHFHKDCMWAKHLHDMFVFLHKSFFFGWFGFLHKTALHLWKLEGFEQKLQGGKTHHTKSSIKPSFLDPNSLTLIL